MEQNIQVLWNVQNNIQTELKNISFLFEDFISKSNKLNAVLKSTINPIANYLESFQKIVNFGLSTAGAKNISLHLFKILKTQRNLDCHLKPIVQNSNESVNNLLAKQLDNWKKKLSSLEKSHQKSSKAIREEYRKALLKERKIKKNPKKTHLLQEAEAQTKKIIDSWKDLEISHIKELMFEEQSRFLALVNSISPFLSSQVNLLKEVASLEEEISSFQSQFKNQEVLSSHAQNLLAQYALACVNDVGMSSMQNAFLSQNFGDDLISLSSSCSFSRRSILSSISDNIDLKNLCIENDEGYNGSNPGELSANMTLGRDKIITEETNSNEENEPNLMRLKETEPSCSESEDTASPSDDSSINEEVDEEEEEQIVSSGKLDDEIIPALTNINGLSRGKNNIPRHYTISGAFSRAYTNANLPTRSPLENTDFSCNHSENGPGKDNRQKSQSNWSLYPNQAIPMPVYGNLNQLQRKISCIDPPTHQGQVSMRNQRQLLHSNSLFTGRPNQEHNQRPITLLDMNLAQFNSFNSNKNLTNSDVKGSQVTSSYNNNNNNYKSFPTLMERTSTESNANINIHHHQNTNGNYPLINSPQSTSISQNKFNPQIMKSAISTPRMNSSISTTDLFPTRLTKTKSSTFTPHDNAMKNKKSGFISRDPFSLEMDQLEYTKNASICHSSAGNIESPDNLSINSFSRNPNNNELIEEEAIDSQIPSIDPEKINLMNMENLNVMMQTNMDTTIMNDDLFQLPPPPLPSAINY